MTTPVPPLLDPRAPLRYGYPVRSLSLGASLSNLWIFARLDPESDLWGLWGSEDQWYCGRLRLRAWAGPAPFEAVRTTFYPEAQATEYRCGELALRKVAWVPAGTPWDRAFLWEVELVNPTAGAVRFRIQVDALWPPIAEGDGLRRAEADQQEKQVRCRLDAGRVLATTDPPPGRPPAEVRLLGTWGGHPVPVGHHFGRPGTARLLYELDLGPDERRRLWVVLLVSPDGEEAARRAWETMPHPDQLRAATGEHLRQRLLLPQLLTPWPEVNRGFEWAKVNTLRVQSRYPAGYGFTNDPPQDILVIRDAAWYIFGSDFVTPDFSREMIDLILREGVDATGKFCEYIRCAEQPPTRDDYGLNINDDTPLFLLALYHHAACSADAAFLRRIFPAVRRAANYILSQMHDDLVFCHSRRTNVWGIAGWRNIIPAFNLSGAVTEINAECCAALRRAAEMARAVGRSRDAELWEEAAERIQQAIHRDLVSQETGLYALARGADGQLVEGVTADMVFPLLFDVAEEPVRQRVEGRLLSPAFWTPYGTRTVGADQPEYDPDAGSQLLGGVWPNLTAWVAYAVRRAHPGMVAEALRRLFRICEAEEPAWLGHVVPGEFPERLHGDTGRSRGMALSPWMPPTYLWLAVSGLVGVEPRLGGLWVQPALPEGCRWVLLRGLPFGGGRLTAVLWEGTLHVAGEVGSPWPVERYDEDCTDQVDLAIGGASDGDAAPPLATQGVLRAPHGRALAVGLRRGGRAVLFVAREGSPEEPVGEPVPVALRWIPAGSREVWSGLLAGGEALRLELAWESGEVLSCQRLEPAAPVALPRPAA